MFRSGFARCPLDGTPLQQLVDDPLTGSMFADRYVIERCIGEGAMGRVYRARHQRVSRKFAIKVLYGDHATDPKMRDRFAREAEAASRLDHPNVISVVDFGETEDGLLYLVMDFVEGRELADVIRDDGPLAPERTERILRGLCAGLSHAHDKGLVHRDFKSENVILTGEGDDEVARIVDFGIAFMLQAADVQRLTTEGMVLGTPAYMSPEQASGVEMDHRTDLYSLGVAMYEMLAGALPFEGPPMVVARMNLAAEPPAISERVPGLQVPPRLEAIAMRLLEKRPDDRYQTAAQVLDALQAPEPAATATVALAQTDPIGAVTAPPRGRARWIAATAAGAIIIAALWLFMRGDDAPSAGAPPAPVAAATPDAAPIATATAPPDAAPVAETPADAGAHRRIAPAHKPPAANRADAAPSSPAVAKRAPSKPITTRDLTERYKAAGAAIERVAAKRGDAVADPLRASYRKIPFADALRTPSLRREVDRTLRRLESRAKAALRE